MFELRCRNNWHIHHKGGQVLICVDGEGWYRWMLAAASVRCFFFAFFSFIPDSVQISGTAYIVFWMSISPCEIKAGADLQGTTLKHQILVSVRNQKNIDTE